MPGQNLIEWTFTLIVIAALVIFGAWRVWPKTSISNHGTSPIAVELSDGTVAIALPGKTFSVPPELTGVFIAKTTEVCIPERPALNGHGTMYKKRLDDVYVKNPDDGVLSGGKWDPKSCMWRQE